MKKSQLKEAIKAEIKSVLSEGMTDKEREDKLQQAKRGGGKEKPLRKLAATGKKEDDLSEDINPEIYELRSRRVKATIDDLNQYLQNNVTASGLKSTLQDTIKFLDQFIFDDSLNEISSTEANAQLMEIVEHQKQILNILKELKKGADLDAAIKIIENEIGKTLTKVKNLKQIKSLKEIQESEEMTDTEMNAKAEKEAKEADKKAKKEENKGGTSCCIIARSWRQQQR